ncbi:hypothetical protein DPMN_011719 [Dreissena polymorpha]|uniref:MAM domain-containing protein n=1 Tax=Dreissena polymorpha TaxID=45954 RepID=A0A9D4S240_DREPO|nr:hypothetical protein DPMN_011719 [Dreissena polymorpha]
MFIETSAPRVQGNKARLYSQVYPAYNAIKCFSFYYHMYGLDIGQLNVYLRLNQSSSSFSTEAMRWSLSGNYGTTWALGQFNISTQYTSSPFQVTI